MEVQGVRGLLERGCVAFAGRGRRLHVGVGQLIAGGCIKAELEVLTGLGGALFAGGLVFDGFAIGGGLVEQRLVALVRASADALVLRGALTCEHAIAVLDIGVDDGLHIRHERLFGLLADEAAHLGGGLAHQLQQGVVLVAGQAAGAVAGEHLGVGDRIAFRRCGIAHVECLLGNDVRLLAAVVRAVRGMGRARRQHRQGGHAGHARTQRPAHLRLLVHNGLLVSLFPGAHRARTRRIIESNRGPCRLGRATDNPVLSANRFEERGIGVTPW